LKKALVTLKNATDLDSNPTPSPSDHPVLKSTTLQSPSCWKTAFVGISNATSFGPKAITSRSDHPVLKCTISQFPQFLKTASHPLNSGVAIESYDESDHLSTKISTISKIHSTIALNTSTIAFTQPFFCDVISTPVDIIIRIICSAYSPQHGLPIADPFAYEPGPLLFAALSNFLLV
jgi:hypothetical protein